MKPIILQCRIGYHNDWISVHLGLFNWLNLYQLKDLFPLHLHHIALMPLNNNLTRIPSLQHLPHALNSQLEPLIIRFFMFCKTLAFKIKLCFLHNILLML